MPIFTAELLADITLLSLAWALGGIIGYQREAQGRAAGLRTHMLVCGGACLLTRVGLSLGDPGRIAAQIVTGIGFLGAGVILRRGVSVRGLTTAATIWVVAGIGIATGAGGRPSLLAVFATFLAYLTLTTGGRLEDRINRNTRQATLRITVTRRTGAVTRVMKTLTGAGATLVNFETESESEDEGQRTFRADLLLAQGVTIADLSIALTEALPAVSFEWD